MTIAAATRSFRPICCRVDDPTADDTIDDHVIHESFYWKEELYRAAVYIGRRRAGKSWPPRSLAKLEKSIMIAAYAVRKLAEAEKIPKEFLERELVSIEYPSRQHDDHDIRWSDIDKLYDFTARKKSTIKLGFLLNQIIHSHVYVPVFRTGERISGIILNSDWTKKRALYQIRLKTLADEFKYIACGDIVGISRSRIGGKWVTEKVQWKPDPNKFKKKK